MSLSTVDALQGTLIFVLFLATSNAHLLLRFTTLSSMAIAVAFKAAQWRRHKHFHWNSQISNFHKFRQLLCTKGQKESVGGHLVVALSDSDTMHIRHPLLPQTRPNVSL